MDLTAVIPSAAIALTIEPEELGSIIIELVQRSSQGKAGGHFTAHGIRDELGKRASTEWPLNVRDEVMFAVHEAFIWLEAAGLIMPDPSQMAGASTTFRVLTRRGRSLRTTVDVAAYREAGMLPVALLHPILEKKVPGMFLRGDHDVAVFQAFKAVEVSVRDAANLPDMMGVKLMRAAFHQDTGPLRDCSLPSSERESEMHLFAGAIGYAKNPGSHREVEIGRSEAVRLILLASQLLFQIDKRTHLGG